VDVDKNSYNYAKYQRQYYGHYYKIQ